MQHSTLGLAVLISGNGSNLQAIIDAIAAGLAANIKVVISDQEQAYGLVRAQRAGIPTIVINRRDYPNRISYDLALQSAIDHYHPDFIILAGFMRILGAEFVAHFAQKIVNIHPSLLPRHPGLNTHQAVLAAADAQHGASVHIVTAELDGGPIIAQASLTIAAEDDAARLQTKVHHLEHQLYPWVIGLLAAGRLQLTATGIFLDNQRIPDNGLQFVEH